MLPVSSPLGFSPMNNMYGASPTGMPTSTGNSMTDFMNGLNNLTYSVTHNADGSDILSWANGLVQQSAIRKQQKALQQQQQQSSLAGLLGGASGASGAAGQPDASQLMQFLMTLLSSMGQK